MVSSETLALCSIFIAIAALVANLWQAAIARTHSRLTVRPHLIWNIDKNFDNGGANVVLRIHNCGLGPAIIRDHFISVEGQRTNLRPVDIIQKMIASGIYGPNVRPTLRAHGLPGINSAILPGGSHVIAKLELLGMTESSLKDIDDTPENATIEVQYESIYEEKFALFR